MKSKNIRYLVEFNKTDIMYCQFDKDEIRKSFKRYLKLRRSHNMDITKDFNLRQYVKEYILSSIYSNIEWKADDLVCWSKGGGIRI
jgi:hypothetical protein